MKVQPAEYWLGTFESYLVLQEAFSRIDSLTGVEMQAFHQGQEEDQPEYGDGDSDYMMTRAGSVAIIDIKGTLTNKNSRWNRYYGITSYPEIKNAVIEAVNDGETESILFSIDSPGGAVSGISELSAFLNDVKADRMPIESHVGGSMNSGAYWLGSVGEKITGTRLSQVGSIGVISVHMEYTKLFKKQGIEATVIRKGKYKALGNPYEKLTPEAKAIIEKDMEVVYNEFIGTVASNRGVPEADVRDNMAEGQVFWGVDAKRVGLIDTIGTIDSVVTQMHKDHNASNDGSSFNAGELTMGKGKQTTQVLTEGSVAAIAAGASVEDAASELGETVPAAEGAEASTDVTTDTPVADDDKGGAEVTTDTDTETEEGVEAAAAAAAPAAEVTDDAVVGLLKTQLADANKQVSDLNVEKAALKKENDSFGATHEQLKAIAVESVNKMQIAMGGTPMDMSHVSASALIDQHASVQVDFQKRFKVGASAEAETQEEVSNVIPLDKAKVSATKISS